VFKCQFSGLRLSKAKNISGPELFGVRYYLAQFLGSLFGILSRREHENVFRFVVLA